MTGNKKTVVCKKGNLMKTKKLDDGCTGQFHSGPFRVWCDEHSNQEA